MKTKALIAASFGLILVACLAYSQDRNSRGASSMAFGLPRNSSTSFGLNRSSLFGPPLAGFRWNQQLGFRSGPFFFGGLSVNPRTPRFGRFAGYPASLAGYGFYDLPTNSENPLPNYFIEQWADRNPFAPTTSSNLSGSQLLVEGMNEEEVMKALGTPVERISLGETQVWKYSGFSVRFQAGKLKELR
jgi:hypothetical protein